MEPVIAIPQMGGGLFRAYMKGKYVNALRRAGAQVRWIELEDVDLAVKQALECDGLLLPGGADIDPRRYGQEPAPRCGKPNVLRDKAEFPMLQAFLQTNKPVLCICRGAQLLNVFFGGTLHQDIEPIQGCRHSRWRGKNTGTHTVKFQPLTKLGALLGVSSARVNSLHHQVVDALGPGLRVAAVSEDGFIEGIEVFAHPFCIGVQWHPEHMCKQDPVQQKLFQAFVSACREK